MPPEKIDSLDKDELKPLVLRRLEQNGELIEQVKQLLARIAELEVLAGQPPKTPPNSSVPPSKGQKANRPDQAPAKKTRQSRPGTGGHGKAHQVCLAHLIRDAQYAIDPGDTVFAPAFQSFLRRACAIGRRRPGLADATIERHARALRRELDRVLALRPTATAGRDLQASMAVGARTKLLVFMTRRDVEPTNNASERALRPSVIFRKVTNGFRSVWGAESYADIRSIVATGRLHGRNAIRSALAGPTATAAA